MVAIFRRPELGFEAERAHVEKHFPPLVFAGKEDGLEVRLDYAQSRTRACSAASAPSA